MHVHIAEQCHSRRSSKKSICNIWYLSSYSNHKWFIEIFFFCFLQMKNLLLFYFLFSCVLLTPTHHSLCSPVCTAKLLVVKLQVWIPRQSRFRPRMNNCQEMEHHKFVSSSFLENSHYYMYGEKTNPSTQYQQSSFQHIPNGNILQQFPCLHFAAKEKRKLYTSLCLLWHLDERERAAGV